MSFTTPSIAGVSSSSAAVGLVSEAAETQQSLTLPVRRRHNNSNRHLLRRCDSGASTFIERIHHSNSIALDVAASPRFSPLHLHARRNTGSRKRLCSSSSISSSSCSVVLSRPSSTIHGLRSLDRNHRARKTASLLCQPDEAVAALRRPRARLVPPACASPMTKRDKSKRSHRPAQVESWETACHRCGTETTPQWRTGPDGPNTLCNVCGLLCAKKAQRYRESLAKQQT